MQLLGPSRLRVQTIFEPITDSERRTHSLHKDLKRPVIFSSQSAAGDDDEKPLAIRCPPLLLHDISVGIDILPRMAGGAVRLLTWVAPFRREAMFEVRLWEQ